MSGNHDRPLPNDSVFENIVNHRDGVPVMSALVRFDDSRTKLQGDIILFASDFVDKIKAGEPIELEWGGVSKEFESVLAAMRAEGSTLDEIVETAVGLMTDDSQQRVESISGMFESKEDAEAPIVVFEREDIASMIESVVTGSKSDDEVIKNIVQLYESDVESDVNIFMDLVAQKHKDLIEHINHDQPVVFDLKKTKMDHILDVAKVALGVSIALGVDKVFKRKNG